MTARSADGMELLKGMPDDWQQQSYGRCAVLLGMRMVLCLQTWISKLDHEGHYAVHFCTGPQPVLLLRLPLMAGPAQSPDV